MTNNGLSILVVDDEPLARQKIVRLLSQQDKPFNVTEARNGLEALQILDTWTPDILILDIEMPGMNGFELLYHLPQKPFKVIFQTAFDEFAVKAFEQNACDYILKPFTPERFSLALNKATKEIHTESKLRHLETYLSESHKFLTQLSIKQGSIYEIVQVNLVDCFISKDHYTCVYAGKREYLTKLSLDHLIEKLDPSLFARVHRNGIVRLSAIKKLQDNLIHTAEGHTVEVSRRNKPAILDFLKKKSL